MNKVLELAKQAGGVEFGGKACLFGDSDVEKFAQLVMRETFEWVVNNVGLMQDSEWQALKKHFGIES